MQKKRSATIKRAVARKSKCGNYTLVYRRTRDHVIVMKQLKKGGIVRATKDKSYYIQWSKHIKHKKGKIFGKEVKRGAAQGALGVLIFDTVMLSILKDMIENKNTYNLPAQGVDLIVAMYPSITKGMIPMIGFDTTKSRDMRVVVSEYNAYAWHITVSRELKDMMEDSIYCKKENFILCKKSLGKQLSPSCRGKFLRSLTTLQKKKE